MTTSSSIPKHVEEVLSTHRRGFLKSAGFLFVNFAIGGNAFASRRRTGNRARSSHALTLIPRYSGKYFSTGSITESFPSSASTIIPAHVIGFVSEAIRNMASFTIGLGLSIS